MSRPLQLCLAWAIEEHQLVLAKSFRASHKQNDSRKGTEDPLFRIHPMEVAEESQSWTCLPMCRLHFQPELLNCFPVQHTSPLPLIDRLPSFTTLLLGLFT